MPSAKIQNLYNGLVVAQLTTRKRGITETQQYSVRDGGQEIEDLLRVTDILKIINKPLLIPWAVKMTAQYLDQFIGTTLTEEMIANAKKQHHAVKTEAADLGTQVHAWAEDYIKTGNRYIDPDIDERVMNGILGFLKWIDQYGVKFTASERMVYSREHHYIGTMDAEAYVKDRLCVIDFKTSSSIWPEMHLQTAAYQWAAEEEGTRYDGSRWIVRFDKTTGEFETLQCGLLKDDFNAFQSALTVRRRINEIEAMTK